MLYVEVPVVPGPSGGTKTLRNKTETRYGASIYCFYSMMNVI